MQSRLFLLLPVLVAIAIVPRVAQADAIYDVSIDTSTLIGNAAGPFSLEFQFTDGSGLGDGNNTVTLTDFNFGAGGGPVGMIALGLGSVSGNLNSGATLTDSSFFNQLIQGFTPGNALSFQVDLTTNVDVGGVPDEFSFSILDNTGTEIPTLDSAGFDRILFADISSATPALLGFASDTSRNDAASGQPIGLSAPVITSPVPEPSALWLLACIFAIFAMQLRSRRKTSVCK